MRVPRGRAARRDRCRCRRRAEFAGRHAGDAQGLADALVDAAVAVPRRDPDEQADNATAAVLSISRTD
uniref:hypothetical protein n=1 Tax=Amycolatopsis sp. CA-096443 TaxID=3239919 RepID=UPI003F499B6F